MNDMDLPERQLNLEHTRTAEELIETLKNENPIKGSPDEILIGLYEDYADELERYAVLRLRSTEHAEDIMHETFLTAHQKLHGGEQVENGRAWLYAILKNKMMNHVSKKTRQKTDADDEMQRFVDVDAVHDQKSNQRMMLRTILEELEDIFSEVLILHDIQGLTSKEIAAALNISINTVSSRIRLGRKKFKMRYQELQMEGLNE